MDQPSPLRFAIKMAPPDVNGAPITAVEPEIATEHPKNCPSSSSGSVSNPLRDQCEVERLKSEAPPCSYCDSINVMVGSPNMTLSPSLATEKHDWKSVGPSPMNLPLLFGARSVG